MKAKKSGIRWSLLLTTAWTALALTACGSQSAQPIAGQVAPANGQSSGALPVQDQIQDFTLINSNKQPVSLYKDTQAKAKLVYFFYSSCGDVCPTTQKRMEKIMKELKQQNVPSSAYKFLSISFDPKRDTPDVLKQVAKLYDATPDTWQFLVGTQAQVNAVMNQFHVDATETSTHDFLHDDRIFLLDGKNQVRTSYSMSTNVQDSDILHDMKQLIAQS